MNTAHTMKTGKSFRRRVANYIRNRLRNQNPNLRLTAETVLEACGNIVPVSYSRGKYPRETATRCIAHYWNVRNANRAA